MPDRRLVAETEPGELARLDDLMSRDWFDFMDATRPA